MPATEEQRTTWRVLRTGPGEPAWNMALDEALLETFAPGDAPVLRLYGWAPAALSLGRFQAAGEVAVPAGARLVRRITGGAAIHHRGDEVTYSVVAPYALFGARDPRAAYRAIHAAISGALGRLGVPLAPRIAPGAPASVIGMCYANATDYDLVAGGKKLVGSAQRRRGHAFLQHGSLPVSSDPGVVGATSLTELLDGPPPPTDAIELAIVAAFQERLAPKVVHDAPRETEREAAVRLRDGRYAADAWTFER